MAHSTHRPNNPYHWQYRASGHYQKVYIALHLAVIVLASYVLIGSSDLSWLLLGCAVLVIVAHGLRGLARFVTLKAKPLEFVLSPSGEFQQLLLLADGTRHIEPTEVVACRWLGSSLLLASLRPKAQSSLARLLGLNRQALVLWHDNSSVADRHRLAMFYHSGPAE